ncbi:MAG: ABC transporter ATP-binding protein [bacterium]|nr:ABC transporter ATP-binding protein [bacterium]
MEIIKRFYIELSKYKYVYLFALFVNVLVILLGNVSPFFIRQLTRDITIQDYQLATVTLIVFLLSFFLKNLLNNLTTYLQDLTLTKVSVSLQQKVFNKLHDLDYEFYSGKSAGSLISILKRGDSALFDIYYGVHDSLLESIISFVFLAISFSFIDLKYLYITILIALIMFLFSFHLVKYNIRKRIFLNEQDDELSTIMVDNMINFETVKYFGNEKFEQTKLANRLQIWFTASKDFFISFRVIELIVGNIANIGIAVVVYIAFLDIQNKAIDLAQFLFIITFANTVFPNFWRVVRAFREIAKNNADLQKYFEILNYSTNIKNPEHPIVLGDDNYEIQFNDVVFKYAKGDRALNCFNLNIGKSESVALVGYSGAGKTTLVKLLMRFFDVDKGEILINGLNIKNFSKSYLRQQIGVVPQEPILFNDTIEYNIKYGKTDATTEQVKFACKIANIDSFISNLPDGYQSMVGERGLKLSGGQKQRLAIARVILKNSKIIVFDEATSNLDSQSEKLIQDAFWKLAKDKTTIIIAHRLSTIMHADKIVVMDKGEIKEVGSHIQLINRDGGIYKKLWELQHNGFIGDNE